MKLYIVAAPAYGLEDDFEQAELMGIFDDINKARVVAAHGGNVFELTLNQVTSKLVTRFEAVH